MTVGALIIFFLIVEPHGLARVWQIIREKLVIWPFPLEDGREQRSGKDRNKEETSMKTD